MGIISCKRKSRLLGNSVLGQGSVNLTPSLFQRSSIIDLMARPLRKVRRGAFGNIFAVTLPKLGFIGSERTLVYLQLSYLCFKPKNCIWVSCSLSWTFCRWWIYISLIKIYATWRKSNEAYIIIRRLIWKNSSIIHAICCYTASASEAHYNDWRINTDQIRVNVMDMSKLQN